MKTCIMDPVWIDGVRTGDAKSVSRDDTTKLCRNAERRMDGRCQTLLATYLKTFLPETNLLIPPTGSAIRPGKLPIKPQ